MQIPRLDCTPLGSPPASSPAGGRTSGPRCRWRLMDHAAARAATALFVTALSSKLSVSSLGREASRQATSSLSGDVLPLS